MTNQEKNHKLLYESEKWLRKVPNQQVKVTKSENQSNNESKFWKKFIECKKVVKKNHNLLKKESYKNSQPSEKN